jgi:shikimate dehydrogenase
MKYGLIGEHLGHSFSKEIHEKIGDYVYEICEIEPQNLENFIKSRDFSAINVTIPYKQAVIPFLDEIDEHAKKIGAVNTIVNKNGKLHGYNTDYFGMRSLILKTGVSLKDKKVAILGTGGTSKTAYAVVSDMGAKSVIFVSYREKQGAITYEKLYDNHQDTDVIINTSPVGMYPKNEECPLNIDKLPKLSLVLDAIYNPLKTNLVLNARKKNISARGGLYMLVSQAIRAYELFTDKKAPSDLTEKIYNELITQKSNIALIGMPSSGKSTVGKLLASKVGKQFIDTDEEIVKREGMEISEIFQKHGESYFRELEAKTVGEVSKFNGFVIATGGGAILKEENVRALKQNGRIYFLDRDIDLLMPTSSRPTASSKEAIEKRYNERYEIYKKSADASISANGAVSEVVDLILKEFYK